MNQARIAFLLLLVLSLFLFFYPVPAAPGEGLGLDKLVHAVVFFGLEYLVLKGFRNSLQVGASVLLYVPAVEILQKYVFTYRSFSWFDMLAGFIGCLIAVWVWSRNSTKAVVINRRRL